jgi:alpha-1,4-digalacturonate transport system substrate-binding protein
VNLKSVFLVHEGNLFAMKKFTLLLLIAVLALGFSLAQAQEPVELRITWYDDGNEGEVLRDLLDRFEEENPDITVVIDTVDYAQGIQQTLPLQIQAGEGPDIARITAFTGLTDYYLDMRDLVEDPEYWDESFPEVVMQAMRPEDDTEGLYGFPTQFTITGPFINRTLFEQAGIPVPSDENDAVTWQEWTDAAVQVAEATDTPYAIAIDRSGHRVAGPAISTGATFLDEEGNVTIDTPGFREFASLMVDWHTNDITPAEVWISSSDSYAAAADYFINGQLVVYMSGSWQIGNFATNIGDSFDWEAVPNPTGEGGSTGMPGGAVLMAIKDTEHPEEVARVMDYLAQFEQQQEFAARTLFIPGHLGLAEEGVEYDTDNELAKNALNVFLSQLPSISEQAYDLNFHPQNSAIFNAIRDRLGQVLTGELTLDEAIERMQQDADDAIAAANEG